MTRRILNKASPGDAAKYGSNDLDYINQFLTGSDQSATDAIDMLTDFKFRSNKLRFIELGGTIGATDGTGDTYIINSSAITSDVTLSLPLLTADDTLAFAESTQTFTNKTIPGGSAATEGTNNYLAETFLYPSHRKVSGWIGGSSVNTIGIGQSGNVTTGTATPSVDTTGKFANWPTATTVNAQAGYRIDSIGSVSRQFNPTFALKFRLNTTTNVRAGVYISQSGNFPTAGSDDPIGTAAGNQCLGLFKRSTDSTNWTLGHKGSNNVNFYDSTTPAIPIDTNPHILRIKGVEGDLGWYYSFDNAAWIGPLTGNDYATTGTAQMPCIYCEKTVDAATDANPKSIDAYWIIYDIMEFAA